MMICRQSVTQWSAAGAEQNRAGNITTEEINKWTGYDSSSANHSHRDVSLAIERHDNRAAQANVVLQCQPAYHQPPTEKESVLCIGHLARLSQATQLPAQLSTLGQAGGAEGMALGDQAARRVHHVFAAIRVVTLVHKLTALAWRCHCDKQLQSLQK